MQVRTNKVDEAMLNKYTKELMLCLPDPACEVINALAEDHLAPVWQVFCGIVLEVHMQGNLSNFTIDPAWEEGLKYYDYVCKHCKKKFTPINLGQVYCSNKCGEAAVAEPKTREVKEDAKSDDSPTANSNTASPSPDDLASRISKLSEELDRGPAPDAGWAVDETVGAL